MANCKRISRVFQSNLFRAKTWT